MKKYILLFIFCFFLFQNSGAQVHLKTGYHYSLPPGFSQSIEYAYSPKIGIEVLGAGTYITKRFSGAAILVNGRYYLNPKKEIDGRFFGFYTRTFLSINRDINNPFGIINSNVINVSKRTSGLGIGVMYGRKIIFKKKYLLEFNIGMGKGWLNEAFDNPDPVIFLGSSKYDIMFNLLVGLKI